MARLPSRLFRIMETQARIDAALRRAETRADRDNAAVSRLRLMKLRAAVLMRAALGRQIASLA